MGPNSRHPIPDSPRCAVLTPAGRGAIATIGVRGAGAVEVVGRRFSPAAGRPLSSFAVGRVVFGRFRTSADGSEELVVGLVSADEVEVHCHGGQAAVAAICDAVVSEGCQLVAAGDWAREQELDPIAAQALQALPEARTPSTAAILLDQYRGALAAELQRIEELLDGRPIASATEAIRRLLAHGRVGLHLTLPWKVVLAGAPNAGKSSLINTILGYERAIVFSQPGTTRDVLTAATAIGGWPVELADVAGLRAAADALEAEGVARARRQVAEADLVVFVTDTVAHWDERLYKQVTGRGGRAPIVAHNKCDLAPPPADGRPAGIAISAKLGQNIEALLAAIAQELVPDPPHRGEAVPFTMSQVAALNDVAGRIARGDPKSAQQRVKTLRLIGA